MNIIKQGKDFLQSLRALAARSVWDWRRCPFCGDNQTIRWGYYTRRPWFFEGRQQVQVQRHQCKRCGRTYSEESALLIRGSWYARGVHRSAIDHWQHMGTSFRRTAEFLRSWLGRQERYLKWRPLAKRPTADERCYLAASTVHRWVDRAGRVAQGRLSGQLSGVACSGTVGADGLWARLRGNAKRVVLQLVDNVSGLIWPPVVVEGEESEEAWRQLFERAQQAGLELAKLRAVTSDGAHGLLAYLRHNLLWVGRQRCVWHLWRSLSRDLGRAAAQAVGGVTREMAQSVREQVRDELVALLHTLIDAPSYPIAEQALAALRAHPQGARLWRLLNERFDQVLMHLVDDYAGLQRVGPEWCWRDFRLRLSHGRNQGSETRLERSALLWAVYHNFTPTQWRSERRRHYRHPGQSPLQVAGNSPGEVSYLDALGV
jgi:transposase-like protein